MAEITKEEAFALADIFIKAYNENNKTNYKWNKEKSYPATEPFDFTLFSGGEELGVQVVRAVSDKEKEFIRPNKVEKVITPLKEELLKNKDIPSISVFLNFENPPESKEDVQSAIFWLNHFITYKVRHNRRVGYFNYNARYDDQYFPKIRRFVSDIEISPIESKEKRIILSYGSSKLHPEPLIDDQQRTMTAALNKAKKYKDVLILIDSGYFPFSDFYIPSIKESLVDVDLKEVWIVDNFASQKRAIRVK